MHKKSIVQNIRNSKKFHFSNSKNAKNTFVAPNEIVEDTHQNNVFIDRKYVS